MVKEFSAKKVDDAIKQGLAELGVTLDDVNVEVLDYGGFLRKAKVRLTVEDNKAEDAPPSNASETTETPKAEEAEKTPVKAAEKPPVKSEKPKKPEKAEKSEKPKKPEKAEKSEKTEKAQKPEKPAKRERIENQADADAGAAKSAAGKTRKLRAEDKDALERARTFIEEVTKLMGFEFTVTLSGDGETVNIDAPERDDSLVIGRHGETLSALSYLAETCIRAEKCHTSVTVDCNGYRGRRAASLSAMARRKAEECVKRRRKIKLEPMDRTDRRTVHSALNEFSGVTTASEGKEPYRCVVILPAGKGAKRQAEDNVQEPPVEHTSED